MIIIYSGFRCRLISLYSTYTDCRRRPCLISPIQREKIKSTQSLPVICSSDITCASRNWGKTPKKKVSEVLTVVSFLQTKAVPGSVCRNDWSLCFLPLSPGCDTGERGSEDWREIKHFLEGRQKWLWTWISSSVSCRESRTAALKE